MREIEAKLDMLPLKIVESQLGLDGKAQQYFTNQVYKYSEPYTPRVSGNFYANVKLGKDYILYNSPFANYLWNGKKFVDPVYQKGAFYSDSYGFWSRKGVQKIQTDEDLNYNGGPMRGPFWINRMWADKGDEIIKTVEKFMEGNNG